jgi:hypothetical protein
MDWGCCVAGSAKIHVSRKSGCESLRMEFVPGLWFGEYEYEHEHEHELRGVFQPRMDTR